VKGTLHRKSVSYSSLFYILLLIRYLLAGNLN